MSGIFLFVIVLMYIGVLFIIANWAENNPNSKLVNSPAVYTLSLAVYCTAWTYYGSIGVAAKSGIHYLCIYLGPIIAFPLWMILAHRINKITQINKISGIADFISMRYGNSRFLGTLVFAVCLMSVLPYISLQLKAISESYNFVSNSSYSSNMFYDATTYITFVLAIFVSYYGTRFADASERRSGLVTSVAFESIIKLIIFIIIGVYVTFYCFEGPEDIYDKAIKIKGFTNKNSLPINNDWALLNILSAFAILLLPRQFHMMVVENTSYKNLKKALWLFPLYLLIFNLFVFQIAWGGNILFLGQEVNSDLYSLMVPRLFGNNFITCLVFLGGFSAAISMIAVSSTSLATMLTNNLIIPYSFLGKLNPENKTISDDMIRVVRRIGVFILIIVSYYIYRHLIINYSLVSIGLVSFVLIAQLAPVLIGGLIWKQGNRKGAIMGVICGVLVCFYTLLIPFLMGSLDSPSVFVTEGLYGISLLRPFNLLNIENLSPIPHSAFWSLLINCIIYVGVSVFTRGSMRERNYAELYVNTNEYFDNRANLFRWSGTAFRKDIENILIKFLGKNYTKRAMNIFNKKYNVVDNNELADERLVQFSENLLSGRIGTTSARILISSVIKDEKFSLPEVMQIIEESKATLELNKKLKETSKKLNDAMDLLQIANTDLRTKDKLKDDFLNTITHELRTPITSIRAGVEVLKDNKDMPPDTRDAFLASIISESQRLDRLIDNITELEKFETGNQKLNLQRHSLSVTINKVIVPFLNLLSQKEINLKYIDTDSPVIKYDEDRIMQVLNNLIGNAIKFMENKDGIIEVRVKSGRDKVTISVQDNGKGVPEDEMELIFDKFYQSHNQSSQKPRGSGLGLAISKQIIELHKGKIWLENSTIGGANFIFYLPKNEKK